MVQTIATGTVHQRIVGHEPILSMATPYAIGPIAEPKIVADANILFSVATHSVP